MILIPALECYEIRKVLVVFETSQIRGDHHFVGLRIVFGSFLYALFGSQFGTFQVALKIDRTPIG